MVQPDPSYVHLSTLDGSWLCWISSSSSIFVSLNSKFSESNHGSANILFLKASSTLVNSIRRFCWNLNYLNSLVISKNLFLTEHLVRLSWSSF